MARGWESKAVEAQQADRQARGAAGPELSQADRARAERRQAAALSLSRVRAELASATQPAHRAMLERAVTALQAEINAE